MAMNHVDHRPDTGNQFGQFAPGPCGGEFVLAAGDPKVGPRGSQQGRLGLREPGHSGADETQQAAVVAHLRLHRGAGGKGVDVRLAQRDVIGAGNGQAKHGPGLCDVVERQPECLGGGPKAVARSAGPSDGVSGQSEQAAPTLGFEHLLGGEPEIGQILDQARPFSRVGDSGGLQRVQIDHMHSFKAAQRDGCRSYAITGDSKPLSVKGSWTTAGHSGSSSRTAEVARICPGSAAATSRAARFTVLPK